MTETSSATPPPASSTNTANAAMPGKITEGVGVVVRVRPLSTKERADPSVHNCIQALPDVLVVDANAHKCSTAAAANGAPSTYPVRSSTRPYQFSVDHVFHTHTSQIEVYEESCKRVVEGVFHGVNGSILAYGATGSGKTHTMFGSTMSAAGIVYQAVQDIFAEKERLEGEEGKRVRVRCSFVEVYNEDVFDLLVRVDGGSSSSGSKSTKRVPLQVRETGSSGDGGLQIPGLTHIFPETLQDFTRGVEHGHAQRFVAATGANAQSSRSHAIITVEVEVRDHPAPAAAASHEGETSSGTVPLAKRPPANTVTVASIQFGDLAGSERAAATSNTGLRLREGGSINRSLLALGAVVQSLAQLKVRRRQTGGAGGGQLFIPYRGSKLTRLLRDSIGGNCRTMMLFCVSPSTRHVEETVNTMKFAMNAREIQVLARRNEFAANSSQLAKKQETVIEELRAELARTRADLAHYSREAAALHDVREVTSESPTAPPPPLATAAGAEESTPLCDRQLSSTSIISPTAVSSTAASASMLQRLSTPAPTTPTTATAAGGGGVGGYPSVSPLPASAVAVSEGGGSLPRPSLSSRAARPSVFAENTRLLSDLEARLRDFSARKEGLYHAVRDAEERERDAETNLRALQWRLATFLVSDAYSKRARGEVENTGSDTSTVGVAGLRKTIAAAAEAQALHSAQLSELTRRLEEADRHFAATRVALLRERQGTSIELLLDNARLRQSCTEAEGLAAHYHQECRSLLSSEAEYAEALSRCVGALQRLRPLVSHVLQHHNEATRSNSGGGGGGAHPYGDMAAAAESADVALLFAVLPTSTTGLRMEAFEAALRVATTAPRTTSLSPVRDDNYHGATTTASYSPPAAFVRPPLAPSSTNGSGSASSSPTRGGRSGSTPQSNQLAEQYRDLVATAESMHLGRASTAATTAVAGTTAGGTAGASRPRHGGRGLAPTGRAETAAAALSRPFGRTVSLTGLTAQTTAAQATKSKQAARQPRKGSNAAAPRRSVGEASPPVRHKNGGLRTTSPQTLQRSLSAPMPFQRSGTAKKVGGGGAAPASPMRAAPSPSSPAATPDRRPGRVGPSAAPRLSPKAMWAVTPGGSPARRARATPAPFTAAQRGSVEQASPSGLDVGRRGKAVKAAVAKRTRGVSTQPTSHGQVRRGSVAGKSSGMQQRLTRSQTTTAAARGVQRDDGPTTPPAQLLHCPSRDIGTSVSPLLFPRSSLCREAVEAAASLPRRRGSGMSECAAPTNTTTDNNSEAVGAHETEGAQATLTLSRLLERSATVPALPHCEYYANKENQQQAAHPSRQRSFLPDDSTVSRSTMVSDSPLNSRDFTTHDGC